LEQERDAVLLRVVCLAGSRRVVFVFPAALIEERAGVHPGGVIGLVALVGFQPCHDGAEVAGDFLEGFLSDYLALLAGIGGPELIEC